MAVKMNNISMPVKIAAANRIFFDSKSEVSLVFRSTTAARAIATMITSNPAYTNISCSCFIFDRPPRRQLQRTLTPVATWKEEKKANNPGAAYWCRGENWNRVTTNSYDRLIDLWFYCLRLIEARVVHLRCDRIRGHEFGGKRIEIGDTASRQPRL